MLKVVVKTFSILTPKERKTAFFAIAAMFAGSLIDVGGIASVAPFLAVLGNPEIVQENEHIRYAYEALGFSSISDFLFFLGVVTGVGLIAATGSRAFIEYIIIKFIHTRRHTISSRLLEGHMNQSYEFFLRNNSAELMKTIFGEVDVFIDQALRPAASVIAYGILILAIMTLLIAVDTERAIIVLGTVGGVFAALTLLSRRWLKRIGQERAAANSVRYKTASEALAGAKELIVLGRADGYVSRFKDASLTFCHSVIKSYMMSDLTVFLVQALTFGGIIAFTLVLLKDGTKIGDVMPVLGLYLIAGYRMLPAAQRLFQATSRLRYAEAAVDAVIKDLDGFVGVQSQNVRSGDRLPFRRAIEFDNVQFSYPGSEQTTLKIDWLHIPVNSMLGIVGATGAGKSTLVDLILGLFLPTSGSIWVDGTKISQVNMRAWQRNIGYVPQQIFLADASMAENIALGIGMAEIDRKAVESAARVAKIHDFITQDLPEGYDTIIGERGVRLSGGQRQRLGIARALYHDPSVLVLDEATNALDQDTETAVMDAITALAGSRTIIIIAHRVETLRNCDMVVRLDGGELTKITDIETVIGEAMA